MKTHPIYQVIAVVIIIFGMVPAAVFSKPLVRVFVSIPPQKYFVKRIGGDHVAVSVMVPPGKSPTTYAPSPDQIKKLVASDVYFRIGVPFENGFIPKIKSMTRAGIVDTRHGIVLRKMEGHHHGNLKDKEPALGDDHTHTNLKDKEPALGDDPHIWMDPILVKTQAHTIFRTLAGIDPDNLTAYQKNYTGFINDLDELDLRIKTMLKELKGKNLFVFHPSFGYFTDAYGLKQVAIETMGKAPKAKRLSRIIKLAKKEKARLIFTQPRFDPDTAMKIASAINGRVVSIDPLAYDYMAGMEHMAGLIVRSFKE